MFNPSLALELAYIAVEEALRLKSSYADVRYEALWQEDVRLHDAHLEAADSSIERGLGVRVLVGGAWGFSSVSEPTRHDVGVAVRRAVEMARAAAILQESPVRLADQDAQRGVFRVAVDRDPMAVSLEEKLELLGRISQALTSNKGVVSSKARFQAHRSRKMYVSSEGAEIEQDLSYSGLAFSAGAGEGDDYQECSYLGGEGLVRGQGWELIDTLDVAECAKEVAESAVELSRAELCPEGPTDIILSGSQVAAHLIRGLGPLFELDRVVGLGPAGHGGTHLTPGDLGSRRLGSEQLTVYSDPSQNAAVGSFGFDDEGVAAERIDLIQEGRLAGYLSGRETAALVGLERSQGSMRASSWSEPPRVRYSNLVLEPGDSGDLEALIADTSKGILLEGPRAFSFDGRGRTFVATCESAWAIEGGRKERRLKRPSYRGGTEGFWLSCDAVAGVSDWALYGGLSHPDRWSQAQMVGAGTAPARFRGVEVGTRAPVLARAPSGGPLPIVRGWTTSGSGMTGTGSSRGASRRSRRIPKSDVK